MRAPLQVAVIFAGALAACSLSEREYATIDAWLLCDECPDSLRRAVKDLGGKAVHTLDRALVGPSPGRRSNKEAQFRAIYASLPAPSVAESAYVTELLDNYVAKYQSQAAISLGDIGGSRAVAALRRAVDSAAARNYRADVTRVVNAVYALASGERFAGTINPATPRFGDTVRVARAAGQSWDGDESVTLHGSPFADSLVVVSWHPDSLAFQAVGPLGDYAVSVTRIGAQNARQAVPLRIVPPGYTSHVPVTAPVFTEDSLPQTRYLLLPSRPGDTTDFFRFTPTGTTTVTASVTASGLTPPTLRWWTCPPLSLVTVPGPTAAIIGSIVDERGAPLDNAQVNVEGTPIDAVTTPTGHFVLANVPVFPPATLRAQRLGFRPSRTSVQLGADSVRLGVTRTGLTDATALIRHSSTLTIPAGACRYLQVLVPARDGPRTLRLRLTAP